jgi:hypothetical protein
LIFFEGWRQWFQWMQLSDATDVVMIRAITEENHKAGLGAGGFLDCEAFNQYVA